MCFCVFPWSESATTLRQDWTDTCVLEPCKNDASEREERKSPNPGENVVRNAASEFTRRTAIASLASLRYTPLFLTSLLRDCHQNLGLGSQHQLHIKTLSSRVLSATLVLSKTSRVLDAKSRLSSAETWPKFDPNSTKNPDQKKKTQLSLTKWGLFISHLRWWERTRNYCHWSF